MGWDITDFGSGDFAKVGLSLVTLRNGNPALDRKPYCEKIMIVRDGQVTPTHFHWNKMEDIIFREGEGDFCMKLWNADPKTEQLIEGGTVKLKVDGVVTEFEAGKTYRIKKGQSVCYTPYIYHTFWAEGGTCLIGEVSMVNDDAADNRFWEPIGRFPEIEEDVPAEALLCTEYPELG
jgi:D-lyxose ketol-isomerase